MLQSGSGWTQERRLRMLTDTDTKGRILLVDDNLDVIDYIRLHLEKSGYVVTTAASGQEAVKAGRDIDIIFMDVRMPGMSGIEACRILREGPHADTPIIFLTADDSEASEIAGLDAGGNEYLGKPVSAVALERRADAYMRRKRLAADLRAATDSWRREALTDALTGALARRYAERMMRESVCGMWVIMCDIDHFKSYNDTFGHGAGDRCLQAVTATLRSTHHDVVRMGGEEFLILVKGADGGTVAERIREGVESGVSGPDGEPVTISVGAVHVDAETELKDAIRHADMLLYQSKHGGRNRVTTGDFSDGMPGIPNDSGRRDFRDPDASDRRRTSRD